MLEGVGPRSPTIQISGAGPAGLAAALSVAAAGRAAIVHERAPDVGHRFHHDFQGLENWTTDGDVLDELAAIGIEPTFEYTPFRETVVFEADGTEHVYRSARPLYYVVRRGAAEGALDATLKAQALAKGVDIRFNAPVHHLPEGGIVAQGPHGSDIIAVGYVFDTDARDGAYAVLSDDLAPMGYAYLLITQGRGTLATCMFADFHRERVYLERTVEFCRRHVGLDMRNARRFGGTGNFSLPRTARRGNLLFVGEAAGFQDALWGFGMRYAMVSGSLAAQALLAGAPDRYDTLWRARMGGLMRTGIVNRYLVQRFGARGYRMLLRRLDRAADPRAWIGRRYRPSWITRALYPLASRHVRLNRRDDVCIEEGCDCTWCRCAHDRVRSADSARAGTDG